jgi:hypothetical protein
MMSSGGQGCRSWMCKEGRNIVTGHDDQYPFLINFHLHMKQEVSKENMYRQSKIAANLALTRYK